MRQPSLPISVAGVALGVLMGIAVSRLLFPFDVGVYEANNWAPAQLLVAGHNPYHLEHALRPPYTIAAYGPCYFLLVGVGLKLFGLQLWFGRLLSVLGAGAALWGVHRIATRLTPRREAGWLAVAALAAQFPLQSWIAAQRPDLVALGFSFAGLALALPSAGRGVSLVPRVAAALLLAAGFHCRQTSVLAAVLAGFWLVTGSGWRVASGFTAVFTVGCLFPALLLEWTSAGGYSEQLWRMPSALPRRLEVLGAQLGALAQGPQFWVLLVAFAAAGVRETRGRQVDEANRREQRLRASFLVFATVALGLALLTSSIPGSNVNYYLEACAALAICFPLAASGSDSRFLRLGVATLAIGALSTGARVGRGEWFRWQALPYQREVVRKIESLTTLSESVYSDYPELVTAAGRSYYFNTIVPYDGRSARLAGIPDRVFDAGGVRLMVGGSPRSHPGYHPVAMSLPLPHGTYPIYLHLRRDPVLRTPDER